MVSALAAGLVAAAMGAELPGTLLHAEQFVGNAKVVVDPGALGGKAVRGTRWYYFCRQVPFPQGDGDYYVWLRLKTEGTDNPIHAGALQDKKLTVLATAPAPAPERWTWVRLGPLQAKRVGPWLAIHGGGQAASQWTMLDGILITRRASIAPDELDAAAAALPAKAGVVAAARAGRERGRYELSGEAFPFLRAGQARLAQAQTRVSAAWDADNLYISARLDEPVLDPAANRRGDFRQRERSHDGAAANDESLEIALDPACDGRPSYRFLVNALGTLWDARGNDKSFESGANTTARVGDGFWTVELTVPLKAIGLAAPTPGVLLGMDLVRHRQAERETSSWSGRLLLADGGDGAAPRLEKMDVFRFGENRVSLSGGKVTALADARVGRGAPVQVVGSGDGRPLELAYTLTDSGPATLQLVVIDNATAMPVCRTPLLPGNVAGTVADVELAGDGDLELVVNEERVAGPARGRLNAKLPLIDGLNAIAVRSSGVTLSGRVRAGEFEVPVDGRWRWTQGEQATHRALDLDACTPVTAGNGGIRAPAPGGVFRRSIAVGSTRAWPNYGEALHLAQGSAQWFHLRLAGFRGLAQAKRPVVLVDVPEGIEVVDAAGYYGNKRTEQPRFTRHERGSVTVAGRRLRRIAFASDRPVRTRDKTTVLNLFSVAIRAPAAGPLPPGSEAELFCHQEDCGGALSELPRACRVRIAPPLDGIQPKKIVWQCWPGSLSRYDGAAGREALLETIARAGFNDVTLGEDAPAAHRHGLRLTALVNFEPWCLDTGGYVKEHPADALVGAAGKPSPSRMCTSCLLGKGWDEVIDPAIAQWLARVEPDHANWDYESSAFTGHLACYDRRCLEAFRRFAGLPAGLPLDGDSIKRDHRQAWLDFMAGRSAAVAERFSRSIKAHRPATLFSMYSGYQCAETKDIYNVDWALAAPHLDLVMCGYGRREQEVLDTRRAAGKTRCVFGCITHPYEYDDDKPSTTISAAQVLRRLCDARGGVLFYSLSNADARTLGAFARVSRAIAGVEEFFLQGGDARGSVKVAAGNAEDVYVFSLGARKLVCLVNETAAPARFEVERPGDKPLKADVAAGDIALECSDSPPVPKAAGHGAPRVTPLPEATYIGRRDTLGRTRP